MPRDPGDWSVPAPLRALLWWPGVAFVLVLVAPEAAAGSIAAAGAVLVAVGALASAAARRIRSVPDGATLVADASVAPAPAGRVA